MKPEKKTKRQSYRAKQLKAFLAVMTLLLLCLGGLGAVLYWAHQDLESDTAKKIRDFVGIPPAQPEIAQNTPVEEPQPTVVEPIPEPEPLPEPEPEPIPEPEALSWQDYLERKDLWPDQLYITFKQSVSIQYNGNNFGEIYFTPGQELEVESLREGQLIRGSVNGTHLIIPANCTNLDEWFRETHQANYILDFPLNRSPENLAVAENLSSRTMVQLREELRQWCIQNYGSADIQIGADTLVFKWLPESDIPVLFRYEAREIARNYLMLQAKLGGPDNYASCQILDPKTGDLLGADSIFIPALTQN